MFDALVVGAGPVGLHLGALLLQEGLSVRILEQRTKPSPHSRAIGIHPPALAALDRAGVAAAMVAEGVHIRDGIARSSGREVARLSFETASPAWPFVLALKQARTEAILEARVRLLDPAAVLRGFCVTSLQDGESSVTLSGTPGGGDRDVHFQARLVVGADGARSTVRKLLGIPTGGRDHPDRYLMGDFPDTGTDGSTAVLHLEPAGIVESFPLPGRLRRWVVHTDHLLEGASAADLARLIFARTGDSVAAAENSMLSAFGVRTRMARTMVQGRVALVGDAAHEISPIGGQGMNLGWLDAAELAPIMAAALQGKPTGAALRNFERTRMLAARAAARQAWLNMALGRPATASFLELRHAGVGLAFRHTPVRELVARRFAMMQ